MLVIHAGSFSRDAGSFLCEYYDLVELILRPMGLIHRASLESAGPLNSCDRWTAFGDNQLQADSHSAWKLHASAVCHIVKTNTKILVKSSSMYLLGHINQSLFQQICWLPKFSSTTRLKMDPYKNIFSTNLHLTEIKAALLTHSSRGTISNQ